jgi:polyhydroxyalkanoate synthase
LSQGTTVAREASRLGVELTRIAWGLSDVAPAKGDRRFADPAWTSNPVFRMIQQSYLVSAGAMDRIVAAMDDGRSGTRAEQAQFAANIVTRADQRQPQPDNLGSERHPVLCPAPGLYVRDAVPS